VCAEVVLPAPQKHKLTLCLDITHTNKQTNKQTKQNKTKQKTNDNRHRKEEDTLHLIM
jgi:hypothetical protein